MNTTAARTSKAKDDGLIDVPRGLAGVVAAETEIGDVRGREGFYHYRGYSAVELAQTRSFEDVWHLMAVGHLPGPAESARFAAEIAALRALPAELGGLISEIAGAERKVPPLVGLRTVLSQLAPSDGLRPVIDETPAERRRDALRVAALTPTILAAIERRSHGLEPIAPEPDQGTAWNWLYTTSGERPTPEHVAAIEKYLVATIDHGFNASTFTARVVASTGADVASAVTAAIGAFSGPLHGGAPDRALAALEDIGRPERIEPWVRARIEGGERIMGFGHAVYRTEDPRARMLREVALGLGGETAHFAVAVEEAVVALLAELKPGRELYANVEFYAGVVMDLCGLPHRLFTPTFAVSRVLGWCANICEQAGDPKIIRPAARYVGPDPDVRRSP